ncbi:MAG: serine--tRNA ligase, partial [Patescibacteria group bacterium]
HSLNNTAIATPRILISIVENNQQEDGSVIVPEVLQKYMGKKIIGKRG